MFETRHLRLVFAAVVAGAVLSSVVGYTAASAAGSHHFRFLSVSVASSQDSIIFTGSGEFNQSSASGSGSYTEFKKEGSPPFPVISSGVWHAAQFQGFELVGTYGDLESGILRLRIVLFQDFPTPATIPATLTVFCDIPAANLSTGQPEGIQLVEPSKTFVQGMPATTTFSRTSE